MIPDLFTPEPMPGNLQPVEFDFGAAAAAASALRDAADVIDRGARMRTTGAREATQDWMGGQRRAFDRAEDDSAHDAATLVRQLRASADDLHDAATAAAAENDRRAHGRARWQHEQQQQLDRVRAAMRAAASKRG